MNKLRAANILSLAQAYHSLHTQDYTRLLNHYGIEIKDDEVKDLASLVNSLQAWANNRYVLDGFYVGYKIPQIGKEFDLLRIGEEFVVNIELKRSSTEEIIKRQLVRNKYYLSAIGKPVYSWSFVSSTKQLYFLDSSNTIQLVDISHLSQSLGNQAIVNIGNINNLFNPSVYLVSPFNSTDKFMNEEYFLTQQQEEIKSNIFNAMQDSSQSRFVSITGSAGTGKTLLVYDIAKEIIRINKRPLIVHCGHLNEGQQKLRNNYGWEIIPIKEYKNHDLSNYDALIVDETQRIYPDQLDAMVGIIQSINGKCIFAYDSRQTLSAREEQRKIHDKIVAIGNIETYKLTEKIRTNKEIASFIRALFNKNEPLASTAGENIEISYFSSADDARAYLESIRIKGWEVLRFTPSQYENEHHETYSSVQNKTSHGVIGQEFDNVAVVIDQFFSYSQNGELIYKGGAYYHPVKMLFQNVTRTRIKLNVVVIGNSDILNRCASMLQT
jgi:AAA domain